MATITNWDGSTRVPTLVPAIGSFLPFSMVSIVPETADDTAGTLSLTFSHLSTINGWSVTIDQNGNVDANNDVTVSASGNVLTIADGPSNYTLATTDTIHVIVWGKAKVV